MDTFLAEIMGASCEFNGIQGNACCLPLCLPLQLPPNPDLVDSAVPSNLISTFNSSSAYYLTAPLSNGAQYVYLSNWQRIVNAENAGLPNFLTWLNAYSASPTTLGTIRQGFAETTTSVNPYLARTVWDFYILGNVYDSLYQPNLLNPTQSINWMTISTQQLSNSSLTYPTPAHTLTTYRFTLRNDLFFQDGRPVTTYDVAFSYLSMVGSGAIAGTGASSMTGITVLGPRVIDIGVNSLQFSVLQNLTSVFIVPGRYWTNAGTTAWDAATAVCTSSAGCSKSQYTLNGATVNCTLSCTPFTTGLMTVNPADTNAGFDPIANHIFIGSGPWQCSSGVTLGGPACSSSGAMNPPSPSGSYTLTRFGSGQAPASGITDIYFRSAGNLALWIWASDGDASGPNILTLSNALLCLGQAFNPQCSHWQHGIGASITGLVGITQISVVERFFDENWIAPFNWQLNPPTGIAPFPPVLYEGLVTLNPCSIDPVNGYDC